MKNFPKFFVAIMIAAILSSGCARKERLAPANERPMYGGKISSPAIAEDSKQNDVMIRQTGSPEAALQKTLDQTLAAYQRGYFELAMHHYNRAWLLDPKSPEVFNGFGLVLDAQGHEDDALAVYEKGSVKSWGQVFTFDKKSEEEAPSRPSRRFTRCPPLKRRRAGSAKPVWQHNETLEKEGWTHRLTPITCI